ncbi:MAG: hypothetical protein ACRDH2_18490 [Anaerolineales bacterium]
MKNELLKKMRATVAALPMANLVEAFELTNDCNDEGVPLVREVLMDELEARAPIAFEAWLECADPVLVNKLSHFFRAAQ